MTAPDSFRAWLRREIASVLDRKTTPPPLLLWCDPERIWRDLLRAAADGSVFELWSDEAHELVLRERLVEASPAPRVVWLPVSSDEISYLKVFELQAERVWTESLVSALAGYGVEIARDHEADLRGMLPAHALEWIDQPKAAWRELTPGTARSTLVDEDVILDLLSGSAPLIAADRAAAFAKRVVDDYGLPAPQPGQLPTWRVAATAALLVTDAAERVPADPPREGARIIPAGSRRQRASKLLARWLSDVDQMGEFEKMAPIADGTTSLVHWARNLTTPVPALASLAVEEALFQAEVDRIARLADFEGLARSLEEREVFYAEHARGFWGSHAEKKIPWASLTTLARAAMALRGQTTATKDWKTPRDAVDWFTMVGWTIDHQGETLFREAPALPAGLYGARAQLQRAYQRHLDGTNRVFSDLLERHGPAALGLAFAGELLAGARRPKEPTAVLVLDACRYDLGKRLADSVNKGEPVARGEVSAARAPLPSITALGMPFALADDPGSLIVELGSESPPRFRVHAPPDPVDSTHNLVAADARRAWLKRRYKVKVVTDTKSVLNAAVPSPKEAGRLLFVFGDELDKQGHDEELEFTGADEYLDRYVRVIRRLRDAGYPCVVVVTDHGFLHWNPEQDEVDPAPTGEPLWRSRRAVVGRSLEHQNAVAVPIPGSDLECRVPRSVNAFRAYGKMGFFHGGASLQELVIPVVVFRWPKKAEKTQAVLAPLSAITSLRPRVEIRPGASGFLPGVGAPATMIGREVMVKIVEPPSRRVLFSSSAPARVEPDGAPVTLELQRTEGETAARGARLTVELRDADNDEVLDHRDVELRIDVEEFD